MMKNNLRKFTVFITLCVISTVAIIFIILHQSKLEQRILWNGNGEFQYRIPGIVYTDKGILIVYCEKRKTLDDWSEISIVEKISEDGGNSWSDEIILVDGIAEGKTVNNPVMIADGNRLHLIYEVEYGLKEKNGGVFYQQSTDEGKTWSKSAEILTELEDYNVFATGPGHGILTSGGRLIIPVWMVKKDAGKEIESHHPGTVSTIYSDDHGATWQLGEEIPPGIVIDPNESTIVELSDGSFLMNIRNQVDYGYEYTKDEEGKRDKGQMTEMNSKKLRAVSRSQTGIEHWSEMKYDTNLIDPVCFGALCKYDSKKIIFVNNRSSKEREMLTISISDDNGYTWDEKRVITEKGGYADIAVDGNKSIFCVAESRHANKGKTEYSIVIFKFNIEWIKRR